MANCQDCVLTLRKHVLLAAWALFAGTLLSLGAVPSAGATMSLAPSAKHLTDHVSAYLRAHAKLTAERRALPFIDVDAERATRLWQALLTQLMQAVEPMSGGFGQQAKFPSVAQLDDRDVEGGGIT
jgi:hypothetical protein